MSKNKVVLNRKQQDFIKDQFETTDLMDAAKQFQKIMVEEGISPSEFVFVLDKIMEQYAKLGKL